MCGRYTETVGLRALQKRFGFAGGPAELKPRYNIAPTQDAPVVINESEKGLHLFRWGLIPAWAKEAIGNKLINARAETLLEKPAFKTSLRKKRCLVIADSFYEWKSEAGAKKPIRISIKDKAPFAMAGLWDEWKAPDGAVVRSFTIITTAANAAMSALHDRMPAILAREEEDAWLDPAAGEERLLALLKPWPIELEAYECSPLVNSPKNDTADCIEPAGV